MTSGTGPAPSVAHAGLRAPRTTLGYAAAKVLLYLLELHARGGGYRIRGMPGWADAATIECDTKTWGAGELLRVQARRGRVHAHDARAPGETRPTWLYRVAQPGADCLAESVGLWAAGVRDPKAGGDPHVLLREGPLRAWQALKLASNPCVPLTRETRLALRARVERVAGRGGRDGGAHHTLLLERRYALAGDAPLCGGTRRRPDPRVHADSGRRRVAAARVEGSRSVVALVGRALRSPRR
jgi:hypothetical protein